MASGKLEALVMSLISVLKIDVEDYCDLETVDGNTLVAQDGSLASILAFHGTKSVLGRDQFEELIGMMEKSLEPFYRTKGHQLQVVFRKDLDASATLDANAQQQHATADRLGLDVHDLIDEGVARYSEYVYDEECYLVFWSRPCLLDPEEARIAAVELNEFREKSKWPSTKNGQNLLRPIRFLYDRHQGFVSRVFDDMSRPDYGCSVEKIDVQEMLRTVRRSVYRDYTSERWQAAIPGTPIPARWKHNSDPQDASEVLYPKLPRQIMVAQGEIGDKKEKGRLPDPTTVRIGSRIYAPLLIEIPPKEPQYFNNLFNALNRAETTENGRKRAVPYSVSFMLESDGMSVLRFRSIFASLLFFSSDINRNINQASKALSERQRDGECIVKLRMAAMTWVGIGENATRELALRKGKLWKSLEAWGGAIVVERTGNPMLAFQSNAVGLTWKHIGNDAPAPLGEALAMMPFTRPASPFPMGSIVYRSLDGKVLRYQRFSDQQTTWISLYSGKPGSGKSVLMNNGNVESCLMPGLTRLPYICVIDFGISSSGFVDLIKDNLPPGKRHLAMYKRLQNRESDCINPMDTPLGLRAPLSRDRAFLVNFLTTLVTPPERRGKAYEGMSDFVGRVIDGAFKLKSDKVEKAQPETYKPGHNPDLDEAVVRSRMKVLGATTYWEIVDTLFKADMTYEAEMAQRYAMPTLNDLVAYAASPEIQEEYGDAGTERGMSLPKAFQLGVREAIGNFPIFSGYTRFDIGPSRVMALDLQDVAPKGSDAATKQTVLMYMMARQAFMKKVAFSVEDLRDIPELYGRYYERLVADLTEDYKVMCMDEYHRTGGHPLLNEQVATDGREARKWLLEIALASQLMEDFGDLTKIATSMFILDAGTPETRAILRQKIGLTAVEESALTNYVHGPGPHGATFLARFVTNNASYSQLFTMTPGAMRMWALSTTAEDRKLRSILYKSMPGNEARALLARKFPRGRCKEVVERMKAEMFGNVEFVDDDMTASVIDRLGAALLDEHYNTNTLARGEAVPA